MQKILAREKSDYRKGYDRRIVDKRQMAVERLEKQEAQDGSESHETEREVPEVLVLTLNHGEHQDATLYRFEKGCRLQFSPGPSLLGRKVFLYTNYIVSDTAEEKGEQPEFVRSQYYALEWRRDEPRDGDEPIGCGLLVDDVDALCELRLTRAGVYHYYFVYDSPESRVGPQGSGWFHVAPTMCAGGVPLPLDGIMCQTVLAKCLGPLPRWPRVLRVAHEAGYNMVHFTPVQHLGDSGSSYSIADQLRVDPRYADPAAGRDPTFADVEAVVDMMRDDWKMLSICDVVLNHTANETPWLAEHPEATYNCHNCPHLRPAALLDALLARLSDDVARGALEPDVPRLVTCADHVEALRHELLSRRLPQARLYELYQCDADALVLRFCQLARERVPPPAVTNAADPTAAADPALGLLPDPQRRRFAASVDMDLALRLYNVRRADCYDEESRVRRCGEALRVRLEQLNEAAAAAATDHLRAAVDNVAAGVRYERLQEDGPRAAEVSARRPLAPRYFTLPEPPPVAADAEALVYGATGRLVMAHNGWVMDADPLQDFAAREHDGRVYLRRELLAWGDSVKLRYGDAPADSPFLWARMRDYVECTARVFDGVRLDNCHSTPLHVAEYLLDCARAVKPDLYVIAELFTNSDHVDNIFVNRLGITSLIREAQSAWDAREQGRLLHRFGGRPVGAFLPQPRRAAVPAVARALLLDLTHDNSSPLQRRTVFDMLPTAALVAMACGGAGSTRGYDELVPHHVHVVDESRLYAEWADGDGDCAEPVVRDCTGLLAARRALSDLHRELAAAGYSEVYVDQMDEDVVAVTRHEPRSRRSVVLLAVTAFGAPAPNCAGRPVPPLRFEGHLDEVVLEASLRHRGEPAFRPPADFVRHSAVIDGLREYEATVRRALPPDRAAFVSAVRREGVVTVVEFHPLPPGAVLAVRVSPHPEQAAALHELRRGLREARAGLDPYGLEPALAALDLADFNTLLFCCDAEERDRCGGGVYEVPGRGALPYAGLQGVVSLLDEAEPDAMGHALCDNLRAGDWLAEYTWRRLQAGTGPGAARLAAVGARYKAALRPAGCVARCLAPAYCGAVLRALQAAVERAALARLVVGRGRLRRALALTSVQLTARVCSAPLPLGQEPAAGQEPTSSMSAGLPHFSVGYMRCWGRDTFISLRGLYLLTGRFDDARNHILAYAACLRHGLVPNLLDGGRGARFNCRDAVWWWLLALQQYCALAPAAAATDLLAAPVARLYPADDSPAPADLAAAPRQPLHDIVQEALDAHFQGLVFRERNAGRQIDAHMADRGFNVQIGVDPETGFVFGGNDANCGTWMDKMGSSEAAGTRGKPATPRDGSAVELVALAYSTATWLVGEHRAGRYPYPGVARRHSDGALTAWTWAQWADRVRRHFERHFWVPAVPSAADARPDLVHRRAIYKDSHGATHAWPDYQLRCNYLLAMAVAPDLFQPRHAWLALDTAERLLLGPLGVKTLDPADWAYRGDYDNSNNGDDPAVAHGFNYHQGPEWVWPFGFYLRARLAFAHENGKYAKTVAAAYAALAPHSREILTTPWRGLPELTNAAGVYCADSCRTQAWSSAAVLEALHELELARRSRPLPAD